MVVLNRFKELGLAHRVPEELWIEVHNIVQEAVTKVIPKKKKCKKAKWLSEEALQIAEERRETKSKGERERYIQLNRDQRERKVFFNEQCIKLGEKKKQKGRLEITSGKLELSREYFAQRWTQERTQMLET